MVEDNMTYVIEEFDTTAGVAELTLNRPDKRNALNAEMIAEFRDALERLRTREDIKVVITRGNGPAFSAGYDLYDLRQWMSEAGRSDWGKRLMGIDSPRLTELVRLHPKIMIAEVHGHCLGGALGLMLAHDLVVADADCRLGMPEVMRGSFGQSVTSYLVHSRVPIKKVVQMQLTCDTISGQEAERWGIVNWAVSGQELRETTWAKARQIASYPYGALTSGKLAVQLDRDLSLSQSLFSDHLVGLQQRHYLDPLDRVDEFLDSQTGGGSIEYRRAD
jgi:enoyl-CoA hydratase/carnithine racemase